MSTTITTFLTNDTQAKTAAGHSDRAKSGRAMKAMKGTQKLDLAALQAAFDGK